MRADGGVEPESELSDGRLSEESTEILRRLNERGTRARRYSLGEEVARGGMGAILRVWDEDLRRHLAMKTVLPRRDAPAGATGAEGLDPKMLARFLEEAQITGQLDHPGIVPVHELGLDDEGRVYFTMRYVKGRDLKEIIDLVHDTGEEEWTTTRALDVMLKVCDAMAFAHSKKVIHRDLKPANVMVGRFGEVYVMDWGLARVLGRDDLHDLRLREESSNLSLVGTDRRDVAREASSLDEDLFTVDGDVIGTPAYMPPEQALGRIADLDARTDVYAVGAMLYHLLGGRQPFVPDDVKPAASMVLMRVIDGPPRPLLELNADVPGELVAICEKAMARDPAQRYADMRELATDLRAFLEHRVVRAYETGAVAELKKWVIRNKPLALAISAAVLAAVGGLGAVGYVQARERRAADVQRGIAIENEQKARDAEVAAKESAHRARLERQNVMRLSALQRLEDLTAEAAHLWPLTPELVPALEAWLARAEGLTAGLHPSPDGEHVGHYAQLAELRSRALPRTADEIETSRRDHPRYAELAAMTGELAYLERAAAGRAGRAAETYEPTAEERRATSDELNTLAWNRVDPDRRTFGSEHEGLALARLALERASGDEDRLNALDTLAWALFANGRDDAAVDASREALALAPPARREEFQGYFERLTGAVEEALSGVLESRTAELRDKVATLDAEVSEQRSWTFADEEDRWWHAQLEKLVREIEVFADPETGLVSGMSERWGMGVERRLAFAGEVEQRTVTGAEARAAWNAAIVSIRDRDECPWYGGLELVPQLGLLPVGQDPLSGLWEFAHVLTGDVPGRDREGRLVMTEASGIVFVLIPGGVFEMGAQSLDPAAPNYDPAAEAQEGPVHELRLAPFFLSKHEMTQGQWQRFTGHNPSRYDAPTRVLDRPITALHPVEQVSWDDVADVLAKLGFELPTEAQWEYATRAGTETPWWTGEVRDTLQGVANLADRSAREAGANWQALDDWPDLDDGWAVHAPVGSFESNRFGLHDVHGNVREWCREGLANYREPAAEGDGERAAEGARNRVFRGGAFSSTAGQARTAYRGKYTPEIRYNDLGVRPARALTPAR